MTHPLTPPPEQLQFWKVQYYDCTKEFKQLLTEVAQWGWDQREPEIQAAADAELEACCEVLARELICDGKHVATDLRMIRRPKPPSLKEQALALLQPGEPRLFNSEMQDTLRRALEALND